MLDEYPRARDSYYNVVCELDWLLVARMALEDLDAIGVAHCVYDED